MLLSVSRPTKNRKKTFPNILCLSLSFHYDMTVTRGRKKQNKKTILSCIPIFPSLPFLVQKNTQTKRKQRGPWACYALFKTITFHIYYIYDHLERTRTDPYGHPNTDTHTRIITC